VSYPNPDGRDFLVPPWPRVEGSAGSTGRPWGTPSSAVSAMKIYILVSFLISNPLKPKPYEFRSLFNPVEPYSELEERCEGEDELGDAPHVVV